MRWSPLVVTLAASLIAAAPTRADDVTAAPATTGTSAADAFDAAARAYVAQVGGSLDCAKTCGDAIVASRQLGGRRRAQVRKRRSDTGSVYAVVIGRGTAWAAVPLDIFDEPDCGMGKCISDRVAGLSAIETATRTWLTIELRSEVSHFDPPSTYTTRRQLIVGCTRDAAPRCALVSSGSAFSDSRARVRGDDVRRSGEVTDTVHVQF